ncbi:MAG: MATE family efflux transporter, partial [Clostridia bacterium]
MRAQKTVKLDMDMCSRPLFGKIILFSLPLVLSGILQLLYNACDIIVVGRFVGTVAMTAVGSTGALVNLIINLFIGLSVGALSATARYIGAQNREEADKIVHTSILISIIGGFVLGIFGFFMAEQFLIWMNTPTNVLPLSTLYLKIFFLGMPFNSLFNFGSSILRACGDTKRPLIFLSIAGVVNVILNLVFVVTFNMSVAGVAIATVISQIISAVLVVICLMKRKGYGRLELRKLKIHWNSLKEILQIGLPAGIQSTIFSISNVIIQASVNSLGDIVMAGNTAAANIEGFVYVSMNSIAQASLTFTGQNYGANKEKNVNLVLLQSLIIVTIVGLVFGLGVFMFGSTLLRIYDTNAEVISYGL